MNKKSEEIRKKEFLGFRADEREKDLALKGLRLFVWL